VIVVQTMCDCNVLLEMVCMPGMGNVHCQTMFSADMCDCNVLSDNVRLGYPEFVICYPGIPLIILLVVLFVYVYIEPHLGGACCSTSCTWVSHAYNSDTNVLLQKVDKM